MVFLGADHGGRALAVTVQRWLIDNGYAVVDVGPRRRSPADDYPVVAERVARAVATRGQRGVLICRSGVGVAIVANKVAGVRAVAAPDAITASRARREEDANVLTLGGDRTPAGSVPRILRAFLTTPASTAVRHRRRLRQVARIDARYRRSRG